MKTGLNFLILSAALSVWGQTPAGLTVKSATSTQTQLTWTGTAPSYTVQRALVGGPLVNIATVTTTSYTDTTLDPYTQTIYQVIAGTNAAAASNQVTVGPPPSGLSLAATAPLIGNQVAQEYGPNVCMTLDGNGDPAFAFFFVDPLNNGDPKTTQLLFRSWNRAKAQWNPVVTVATPGNVSSGSENTLAIAYDSGTNAFAVATQDLSTAIRIYMSADGGVTWTLKSTFSTASGTDGPAIALGAGNIYFAYQAGGTDGLTYVTGKLSADPATWTSKTVPVINNVGASYPGTAPAIALDNTGTPAIAFWAPDITQSYNRILFFWRPAGTTAPVQVTSTHNNQSDQVGVRMVFSKGNPRIGFAAYTGDSGSGEVHFVRSDDGGVTWLKPVLIPPDTDSTTDYPLDIAIDSQGNGAILFNQNSSDGTAKCAVPKLALSSDLVNWTTCQAAPSLGSFMGVSGALQIVFGGNDKRIVFFQSLGDTQASSGVVMYREPPANQPTGPVISSVQDAESSRTSVVPGEWVALYGANLAATSRTWAGSDFVAGSNNLPTNLSGVSVQFNGLPAAVYYISATQIDVQVPTGIAGTVPVTVTNAGVVSTPFNATVVANAPTLFYYPGGSSLYPAAIHLDGTLIGDPAVIGSSKKATAGETIVLFVNGLAASPGGTLITAPIAYSGAVTVTIGTTAVTPSFVGLVAAGEYQINVVVPSGLASGNYPITVSTAGQTSPSNIILPVQ